MKNGKKSTWGYLEEFIIYKHSLGYIYETQSRYLKRYAAYEESLGIKDTLPKESIDRYLSSLKDSPGSLYGTVCALREFSRYLVNRGITAYTIPSKTVSQLVPEPPYFFTEDEITRFFLEADRIEPLPQYKGREIIVPAFFRLMCCCGVRCKEARMLLPEHVSFTEKYIDIMGAKGKKDRRVYITEELSGYLHSYDRSISGFYPDREYFFPGFGNKPYLCESFVCGNFKALWKKAFPDMPGECFPRAYDFRHHFAWANINRWAAEGMDVNVMLPYLMRYMGHKTIKQTLYYFHFVPEFYAPYRKMTEDLEDILPEVPQ